jgi:hypothetical protein
MYALFVNIRIDVISGFELFDLSRNDCAAAD